MGVDREVADAFAYSGGTTPVRLVRQANGQWSLEFEISYEMRLRDGREIRIEKRMSVRANEQRGRRSAPRRSVTQEK